MEHLTFSILQFLVGFFVGILLMLFINYIKDIITAKKNEMLLEDALKEAAKIKRDYLLEAKEDAHKLKLDTEKEIKEKRNVVRELEERLNVRENNIERRDSNLQKREELLDNREESLNKKQKEIQKDYMEIEEIKNEQFLLLEKISSFSKNEAKELVLKEVEKSMELEVTAYIKEREEEAKIIADKKAKSLLVSAMERYASDVSSEQTVTVVNLPNDEMKGRIIGREGRNIRTIEAVTGVDLIIDDTPEAFVLSSFDPLRREIARVTVETLIKDGRIHPGRIEEVYDKTCKEMQVKIREYGESALFELGLTKVNSELINLLGKLHFRTSYGQNVLKHSIEVGHLAGILAAEIGENVNLAKRAGLLHDIGKAIDHEVEGNHTELGAELAQKYNESEVVIDAITSHHGEVQPNTIIAELVAIADALSASRPGARNDSLENYIKRLSDLENIAKKIDGVDKSYAIQAGRELRVIVNPKVIDDLSSRRIARNIKKDIEEQLQYPGTIKVTVIRETRTTEEAK